MVYFVKYNMLICWRFFQYFLFQFGGQFIRDEFLKSMIFGFFLDRGSYDFWCGEVSEGSRWEVVRGGICYFFELVLLFVQWRLQGRKIKVCLKYLKCRCFCGNSFWVFFWESEVVRLLGVGRVQGVERGSVLGIEWVGVSWRRF